MQRPRAGLEAVIRSHQVRWLLERKDVTFLQYTSSQVCETRTAVERMAGFALAVRPEHLKPNDRANLPPIVSILMPLARLRGIRDPIESQ